MADDGGDVPPLDDMSDLLQQAENIRESREKTQSRTGVVNGHSLDANTNKNTTPTSKPSPSKQEDSKTTAKTEKSSSFGGFQKGFLFGGNKKSSQKPSATAKKSHSGACSSNTGKSGESDVPFIKPKSTPEARFEMPEVQEAMKASQAFAQNSKDWLTEDLLTKVARNEVLAKRLADPSFMQALAEFQTNPTGAMQKYKDNEDVQAFLKEFCGIMGEHFSKMGDQQGKSQENQAKPQISTKVTDSADLSVRSSTNPNQPTADDERRMQEILNDPETREVLMDPQIQQLIQTLKMQPHQAQSILSRADHGLKKKIKRLVDVGLLQLQT